MGGYILSVGFGLHLQLHSGCLPILTQPNTAVPIHLAPVLPNRIGPQWLVRHSPRKRSNEEAGPADPRRQPSTLPGLT